MKPSRNIPNLNKAKASILGLQVDRLGLQEAVASIVDYVKQPTNPAGYVVRPHVEFIEKANKSPRIMRLLNNAQFCLVDGVALQWAAYYLQKKRKHPLNLATSLVGIPLRSASQSSVIAERIAGTTFTLTLLKKAASSSASIFLVGNPQRNSIAHTAKYLSRKIPKLSVVGTYSAQRLGPKQVSLEPEQQRELLKILRGLRPDIILIGLGFPQQEEIMALLSRQLQHGLFIGEGGTFDYKEFGGHIQRAPALIRKSGLEWLWRLGRQPKRLRRQLAIPRFIWRVYRAKGGGRPSKTVGTK